MKPHSDSSVTATKVGSTSDFNRLDLFVVTRVKSIKKTVQYLFLLQQEKGIFSISRLTVVFTACGFEWVNQAVRPFDNKTLMRVSFLLYKSYFRLRGFLRKKSTEEE